MQGHPCYFKQHLELGKGGAKTKTGERTMAVWGGDEELANLARKWQKQLQQLGMLAGRLELDKHNKAYSRMLVLRAESKLHNFASVNNGEVKPDKSKIKQVSGAAIDEMAQTLNFVEAAAQVQLAFAKQDIRQAGAKRDATWVQKAIDRMDEQYWMIEAELKDMVQSPFVKVQMTRPVNILYLQSADTVEFTLTGPPGGYVGMTLWHVPGTGGHKKGVNTNKNLVGCFELAEPAVEDIVQEPRRIVFAMPESEQEVRLKFIFKDLSGKFVFIAAAGDSKADLLQSLGNRDIQEPLKRGSFEIRTVYQPGLISISDFEDKEKRVYHDGNMVFYQGNTEETYHSSKGSHYGQPELIEKNCEVASRLCQKYPNGKIWINDMSLPDGGTFKENNIATKGHKTHKTGRNVDKSFKNMTSTVPGNPAVKKMQRIELDIIIRSVFGNGNVLFHGGPRGWHWHCGLDQTGGTGQPVLDVFVEYYRSGKRRDKFVLFLKEYGFYNDETFEKCGYTLRGLFFRFFREFQTTLPKACL